MGWSSSAASTLLLVCIILVFVLWLAEQITTDTAVICTSVLLVGMAICGAIAEFMSVYFLGFIGKDDDDD